MLSELIARAPHGQIATLLHSRGRRIAVALAFGACLVLSIVGNVELWQSGVPRSPAGHVFFQLVIITGSVLLWLLFSYAFRHRRPAPLKTFWAALLVGLLFIIAARLVLSISLSAGVEINPTTAGFEYGTGVPLTLASIVKMTLLSLAKASLAFYLLLRMRDLVLFKRTRRSQRNWHLMLALMGAAALSALWKDPGTDTSIVQWVAIVPAVILITINSFRVSWIVFLSFREKAAGLGLSVLLLIVLSMGLDAERILPGLEGYVQHFSYPVHIFSNLALGFGILYSVTSFLFLLFHLPTTSDFQRKAGEVTAMHSLTNLVGQVFDSERLYHTIAATPVEAGSGQFSWLALADPRSGSLRPRIVATSRTTPEAVNEMIDLYALYEELDARGESIVLEEAPADHRVNVRPGDALGSLLMAPLMARNDVVGALFVARDVTHGFEQDDLEAISVYAAQAAIVIENARLFEEQVEKERLARELDIAREVQRKLLPQRVPSLKGLDVAASSVSAYEVGGDYYDFLQVDENRLAFIVGDVSGKGTSAAFYMAWLQGIFRSVSRLVPTPAAFLEVANSALASALERHTFISVIYGIVDVDAERVSIARGGHCPAAFINLNGEARYVRSRGLGLGLDRSGLFRETLVEETFDLQPGDVFVLYTDGVVESRSRAGDEYGYDRLLSALRACRHEDAAELHRSLLKNLDTFLGHDEYDDDLTLVVLKWHGITLPEYAPVQAHVPSRTGERVGERIESD